MAADPVAAAVYVTATGPAEKQVTHHSDGGRTPVYTCDGSDGAGIRALAVSRAETVSTSDAINPLVQRFTGLDVLMVTTDPTTPADARTATSNTSTDPEIGVSRRHLGYGIGLTCGSHTPDTYAGAGAGSLGVAAVEGLRPNTTHHHRAAGSNGSSPTAGPDQTFTTAPVTPPVDVVAPYVSAITPRTATIYDSVKANNTLFVTDHCADGTTTAHGSMTDGGRVAAGGLFLIGGDGLVWPVATQLSGPKLATTHHFRVDDSLTGGVEGADRTLMTAAAETAAAIDMTAGRATLLEAIEAHAVARICHLNYRLTAAYGFITTAEADGGVGDGGWSVTRQISGLAPLTTCHVPVVDESGDGEVRSGEAGALTTPSFLTTVVGARPVSASLTGSRVGETFGAGPVVAGGEADGYSGLITSGAAADLPSSEVDPRTVLGYVSPYIDADDQRPDRGGVITIGGHDLGLSETSTLMMVGGGRDVEHGCGRGGPGNGFSGPGRSTAAVRGRVVGGGRVWAGRRFAVGMWRWCWFHMVGGVSGVGSSIAVVMVGWVGRWSV
jgi:hypothetical protein